MYRQSVVLVAWGVWALWGFASLYKCNTTCGGAITTNFQTRTVPLLLQRALSLQALASLLTSARSDVSQNTVELAIIVKEPDVMSAPP